MRRFYTLTLSLFVFGSLLAQNARTKNTTELSHWETNDPVPTQWGYIKHNSCWGYAAPDGREYAIMGATDRIYFVDVTNPAAPKEVASFMGIAPTVWREFKSYKDRVYAVADGSTEGLQIFDMTGAPNNIKRTYFSNEFFGSSHTITMDTENGIIFLNSSNGCIGLLSVKDNPDKPVWLGSITMDGVCSPHDTYFEKDILYVSNGNAGLFIYDVKDLNTPKLLATTSTNGYNHSGCTDKSGKYFYYLEEIPEGRPGQIVDLSNLQQGEVNNVGTFFDPLLTPAADAIYHNPFRKDDLMYIGAYEDGLVVYDIKDPLKPRQVAWFDPSNNSTYNGYTGVWSVYPWLPSGNVIVGDMVQGLFMVRVDLSSGTSAIQQEAPVLSPNPVKNTLFVQTDALHCRYLVRNMNGQTTLEGALNNGQVQVQDLRSGVYALELQYTDGSRSTAKFVKI